jgi:hypothetical protein
MEHSINLNYMYCMNSNCQASIYHRMIIGIGCNTKSQDAMHRCIFCDQQLTSGRDLVITLMVTAVNNQRTTRLSFLHN